MRVVGYKKERVLLGGILIWLRALKREKLCVSSSYYIKNKNMSQFFNVKIRKQKHEPEHVPIGNLGISYFEQLHKNK